MESGSNKILKAKFLGCELFLDLFLKHLGRKDSVLARIYSGGSWYQLSCVDICSHISKSIQYLETLLQPEVQKNKKQKTIIFVTQNSYSSFVSSLAAVFSGYNCMFAPNHMTTEQLLWCKEYFSVVAVVTDREEYLPSLKVLKLPIIGIEKTIWTSEENFPEPTLVSIYRDFKLFGDLQNEEHIKLIKKIHVGRFAFVSFGHDGFQKPEYLYLDSFVTVAQSFLQHSEIPGHIPWHSFEIMSPNSPFSHISKFCAFIKNGIIGFQNHMGDLETNLRILRPTYSFVSSSELSQMSNYLTSKKTIYSSAQAEKLGQKMKVFQEFLLTNKAMKIPENIFFFMKRAALTTSKVLSRDKMKLTGFDHFKFVVHGLTATEESSVKNFEKHGIPIIETYGTTHAAGIITSNLFKSPHFGTIGTPLSHITLRLGAHSTLEYKISSPLFEDFNHWIETGDTVQMSTFGLMVSGRKKHLFTTNGGTIVSPYRLERILKEHSTILDACVVGDKMPYLCALLVLNKEQIQKEHITKEQISQHVQDIFSTVNETLPRNVTLKKFKILDQPFSEAYGERLSSGEINRIKIMETRAQDISEFYNNA